MTRVSGARRLGGDRGATAVEFALLAPLLIAVVGALLVLGLRAFYGAAAGYASTEAARYASIPDTRRTYPSEDAVRAHAATVLPTVLGTPSQVEVCPPSCTPACPAAGGPPTTDPARSCSVREGQPVTVTVTWDVPVLSAALGLVSWLPATPADGQVARSASRRRE